ncbi:harpin-induced protein 1 domain containing protein, expressed [Datura stramonium]|uniref:Harpin-induced protein 1 domain containing protein, expressed n=1 Tax=Datura stramonium TaxID=4076 RepID=A0ABS8S9K8_DATST|nr:harpin-induced protein 1 domain containing protein, expressed [Datura stramonium]
MARPYRPRPNPTTVMEREAAATPVAVSSVKFYVTILTLTQFDLSNTNNTLYYDLALNMTVRNPNKRIGIYYDSIEARAMYQGQRFDSQILETFYQGHREYLTFASSVQRAEHCSFGRQRNQEITITRRIQGFMRWK